MIKQILFFAVLWMSTQVFAQPSQIVIVRHGEKTEPSNELNTQGCERAFSLPNFFLRNPIILKFGAPIAIYAARPDSIDGSVRSIQTIAPTANQLGLSIHDSYTRLDYPAITQDIMNSSAYNNKTVLISWEHDAIPGLAQAFGVTLESWTKSWPDNVFDEAWIIDLAEGSTLQIIPENVLSTDNPEGDKNWSNGPTSSNPPVVSSILSDTCQNNNALNSLVQKWVSPTL